MINGIDLEMTIFTLVLLLGFLFPSSWASIGLCGYDEYDAKRSICCEGALYSKHHYICCNEKLEKKFNCSSEGKHCKEKICCGTEMVIKENHLCCDNNVIVLNEHDAMNKDELECCGKQFIRSNENKTCCGGRPILTQPGVVGCCGGRIYDILKERCKDNKRLETFENLCAGKKYDMRSASCCGGRLNHSIPERIVQGDKLKLNPDFECCGQNVINPDEEKCCHFRQYGFPSHAIPVDENAKCCGKGYYNMVTEACINYTAVKIGEHEKVCGSSLINTSFEDCCANKLRYSIETEDCCAGSHSQIISKDQKCCNGYGLTEKEICCQGNKPCKKENKNDDKCCFNYITQRGKTFSSKESKCISGSLRPISSGQVPCGPSTFFSPFSDLCCQNHVYSKEEGFSECCGNKACKKGEMCCARRETRKRYGTQINETVYSPCKKVKNHYEMNRSTTISCGGLRLKKSSKRKKCCVDREVYDTRYSSCNTDLGKVESLINRDVICKSRIFDGAFEEACTRNYSIIGKVRDIKIRELPSATIVTMTVKNVRTLPRQNGLPNLKAPHYLTISIEVNGEKTKSCLKYYQKRLRKFMIFFDEPIRGNQVQIFNKSPFFITKFTRRRYKNVTKGITERFCQPYKHS